MRTVFSFLAILFLICSCKEEDPVPEVIVDFTSDKIEVEVHEAIQFSDLSSGQPVSWDWEFEGGSPATSISQNPVVTYHEVGVYSVTLRAKNQEKEGTLTKTAYISVQPQEISVAFEASTRQVNTGESIQFSDISTGEPIEWEWEFENGIPATSTEQHPEVVYNNPGVWKVKLTATNQLYENTIQQEKYIVVLPANGIVAHYPLDNNSDDASDVQNDAIDESFSGTSNRFSIQNKAVSFNGVNDFIAYPHHGDVSFRKLDDFSVSIWVKADEQQDVASTYNAIISKWNVHPDYPYPFAIRLWNNTADEELANTYYARQWYTQSCDDNQLHRLGASGNLTGEWVHIAFVKSQTNLKLYVNNVLQSERFLTTNETMCDTFDVVPLLLARRHDGARNFAGALDDLRIYNLGLDTNSIEALYLEDKHIESQE